jgi:hypothetical protein
MLTPPFRANAVSGGSQVVWEAIKQAAVALDNKAAAVSAMGYSADRQVGAPFALAGWADACKQVPYDAG